MPRYRIPVLIIDEVHIFAEADTPEKAASEVSRMSVDQIIEKGKSKGCQLETKLEEIEEVS